MSELQDKLDELMAKYAVPGVAAAVVIDGEEQYAYAGVTSVENPLPVDETTLFQFGSTGKTFTATAMLRLVQDGRVELDAPVRRYVPELRLQDESVAERVTIKDLFTHTVGWQGDSLQDTGPGDDALAKFVEHMATLEQVTPLGGTVSYNNASLSLAGRVIEKVTGSTFEQAMKELVLDPAGLTSTYFWPNEIMTYRFVVGHSKQPDGSMKVMRPWALPRSGNPAGGMSANARDQLTWAKIHLNAGTTADGSQVLEPDTVALMQQPHVEMPGNALGDYVGISWLLRDVGGKRLVTHGGTTIGQYSAFVLVPEAGFGFISMTNGGPDGSQLNRELEEWALQRFAGVVAEEPETVVSTETELAQYAGRYETIAAIVDLT